MKIAEINAEASHRGDRSRVGMLPLKVTAPTHPLADGEGRVPAEVFDVPPELMRAIRSAPIRSLWADGSAGGPEAAPSRPQPVGAGARFVDFHI